ncbi:arginyltransferase [Motiliproteus sp. MSK22-1]|uniref:arginyltransferase n=1 Tax=Motiliproteus sp. MSK22-1 TaxID=1897630 RepID=UPI0009788342|nr:arginyltransferase [Motiliproteus sp. MSK22-1]OMH32724.1 arginyltransferase [Motiliproteus sp. MSK22-1]
MTDLRELQFYATPEHPCSYLSDRQAKTLFADPKAELNRTDYSALSDLGFRRSGPHVYRPHCGGCSACISARIPVDCFKLSKSQKRVFRNNQDLTVRPTAPVYSDELYDLYERYINHRHFDGDMYPPSPEQFRSFLVDSKQDTFFYQFKSADRLLAVAVVDRLDQGLSAIYTFFDPDESHRSLGKFSILKQIEAVRDQNLPYLYLGYWIKGCQKMNYKIDYRPIQLLLDGHWTQINTNELSMP